MTFSIEFCGELRPGLGRLGRIVVGDFCRETFFSCVSGRPWREADYERSWREGVRRVLEDGRGVLITYASARPVAVSWWPLYRVRGWVIAQPGLLWQRPRDWCWDEPWAHVPPRRPPLRRPRISDYRVPVSDVDDWLALAEEQRGR
ncbi:MAG: hypothetical protein AB7N76_13540 [Planctomycetota bacterium]